MTSADAPLALAEAGPDSSEPGGYPATFAPTDAAPDVADEAPALRDTAIDWVGMQGIEMPILFDAGDRNLQRCRAGVDAFVNLMRPDRRGIHMSRLYLLANQRLGDEPIEAGMLESLLRGFLRSHHGLADRARIRIQFEYLVRRKALRSHHHGWRAYPVCIDADLIGDAFHLELGTQVVYSSTCPASAALSRQLVQQQFAKDFPAEESLDRAAVLAWLGSEHGIMATPHAQRSLAHVRARFVPGAPLDLARLLDRIEGSLGTAVQTAVKREDEQAFARANGENPMFCEDAARRIRCVLDCDREIAAFHVRVEHQESLHPHDAVAEVRRNFPGSGHAAGSDHGSFL